MNFIEIMYDMISDMMTDRDRESYRLHMLVGNGPPQSVKIKHVAYGNDMLTLHLAATDMVDGEPTRRIVILRHVDDNRPGNRDEMINTNQGYVWERKFDMQDPDAVPYIRRKVAQTLGII
jgi:hypothetical protein